MSRIRMLVAFCGAIAVLAGLATVSSAADTKLFATMNGKQEKPAGDPNGTGKATLTFKATQVCYDIRPVKAGLTFAAGHIHKGAKGVAGDVVLPLFQSPKKLKGGKLTGCATAKASVIKAIKAKPSGYYVNVHSGAFPAGVIRGQLSKTAG